MQASHPAFWRDPFYLAALAAGLVFWGCLFLISMPRIDPGWPLRDPARFLYPALIWPVVEEILFRGLLQGELRRHLGNAGIGPLTHANLVTSLVFSALHFIHHPPGWAAAVFLPSLLFGLARERSGTLLAPIVLHAFYNSGYLWLFGA